MMIIRWLMLVVPLLLPLRLTAAGFARATVDATPPIEVGIWYPSPSPVLKRVDVPFGQALAVDGDIEGTSLPLVVLSHGNRGSMRGMSHTALALADAGYVVVALTHPGDNDQNLVTEPFDWLVSRPQDIADVIAFMLSGWAHADRIAPDRIGVHGFSMGGYTALVSAGAVWDAHLANRFCAATPDEPVCHHNVLKIADPDRFGPRLAAVSRDARIGAVSAVAPGFGWGFDRAGLAGVTVPVQIWSGGRDTLVPHPTNGANIAANLPAPPEVHVVEEAGHFAFMPVCHPDVKTYDRYAWNIYCVDAEGFDRAAFHEDFHEKVIAFFDAALGG